MYVHVICTCSYSAGTHYLLVQLSYAYVQYYQNPPPLNPGFGPDTISNQIKSENMTYLIEEPLFN